MYIIMEKVNKEIETLKNNCDKIQKLEQEYKKLPNKNDAGQSIIDSMRKIHCHSSLCMFNYKLKIVSSKSDSNHTCNNDCICLSIGDSILDTMLCVIKKVELQQRSDTGQNNLTDTQSTNYVQPMYKASTQSKTYTIDNKPRYVKFYNDENGREEMSLGLSNVTSPANYSAQKGGYQMYNNANSLNNLSSENSTDELSDTELENLNTERVDEMLRTSKYQGGGGLDEDLGKATQFIKNEFNKVIDYFTPTKDHSELQTTTNNMTSDSLKTETSQSLKNNLQNFKNEITSRMNMSKMTTLDKNRPTLVNFWSSTCGPSRAFIKHWDSFVASNTRQINTIDIDCTEDNKESGKFQDYLMKLSPTLQTRIDAYPTVLLYNTKNGSKQVTEMNRSKFSSIEEFLDHEL